MKVKHSMNVHLKIYLNLLLTLCTIPIAFADDLKESGKVYIASSVASVRTAPHDKAPIAARLPIGTEATYIGSTSDLAAGPNRVCEGGDLKGDQKWSCVCVPNFRVDYGVQWCGWVARELLSTKQSDLTTLFAEYDKTPAERMSDRKKWAERAFALDPLNMDARKRLIDVLEKLKDAKAIETAQRSFDLYSVSPPPTAGAKLVFYFDGSYLEPIAELRKGQLVMQDFNQATNYEFRDRGQVYNLYSGGSKLGMVVTEAQFDCKVQLCPQQTIARAVSPEVDARLVGIATNFAISNAEHPIRIASKKEEAILQKLGTTFVKSLKLDPRAKKTILKLIRQGESSSSIAVGAMGKDGRIMLISNWVIGSMNDAHYGNEEDVHESILVIAEQQNDGSFRVAAGSGSIAEMGCSLMDYADIDGDGVDEIFLSCEQLEGQYSYALMKRTAGRWQVSYGPGRN